VLKLMDVAVDGVEALKTGDADRVVEISTAYYSLLDVKKQLIMM
jgi:hypothetical protein